MALDQRATLWLNHIKAWQKSGTSQCDYCKHNGLNPKTFSNWKKRLRKYLPGLPKLTRSTVVPPISSEPLVRVQLADNFIEPGRKSDTSALSAPPRQLAITPATGLSLLIGGKYQISVGVDFDGSTLRRLVDVLSDAAK